MQLHIDGICIIHRRTREEKAGNILNWENKTVGILDRFVHSNNALKLIKSSTINS